ncbi:MAG: hypothetical protein WAQ05_00250 [Rubrivivax sp.]
MTAYRHWAALALAVAAAPLQAETSPWYVGASQAYTRTSNLLRLSDTQAVPGGFQRSDTISSTSLLGGLDLPIGRQRVYGNMALRSNRMANNELFDNQGYTLTAGLDWATVERLSGSLKLQSNRNLASFNAEGIGFVPKKNVETSQQLDAALRLGVVTAWTAELNVGTRSVDYTAQEYLSREFRQDSASLGLRWRPVGPLALGAAWRETRGRYPHFRALANGSFEADRFDRRDLDLTAYLDASGASTVSARLSLGRTAYEEATQRDFSGVTGQLRWDWRPTGRLRLDTRLTRDPSQSSYFFDSPRAADSTVEYSRVTTGLRLRADYEVSAKVLLNTSLAVERRSLARTLPTITGAEPLTGNDRNTRFALGATWTPSRALLFGCDLSQDRRRGDGVLSIDFSATTTSCYAQVTLQ